MGVFFGTDGLRGSVNVDLTSSVAYRCGNSLGVMGKGLKVIIGRDTRGFWVNANAGFCLWSG